MSTESKSKPTEENANIAGYQTGRRSWQPGPLTIDWTMDSHLPLVYITVHLGDNIIKTGSLNPLSLITPITLSFKGSINPGIHEILTNGTLSLDLGKKQVTYDLFIHSHYQWHYEEILFNY